MKKKTFGAQLSNMIFISYSLIAAADSLISNNLFCASNF